MRILHLSTSESGGAGIAARRIAEAQKALGHDVHISGRSSKSNLKTFIEKAMGKVITIAQIKLSSREYGLLTPISISNLDSRSIKKFNPDIIHVHNWYNLLTLRQLELLSNSYPLVFSLHDARLFTGGCHVSLSCTQFDSGCLDCPGFRVRRLVKKAKSKIDLASENFGRFALVSPSEWMLKRHKLTVHMKNAVVREVIENPIPEVTGLTGKFNRDSFLTLLFVSASLDADFKGIKLLLEAVDSFAALIQAPMKLILVGDTKSNHKVNSKYVDVVSLGKLSEEEIRILMGKASFLVVPSLSDNKPSVIREAQLSSLVVIATNVGGIPEMIIDGVTGYLSPPTTDSFCNTLMRATASEENDEIARRAHETATHNCSPNAVAEKYLNVYREVIAHE